MSVSCWWVVRLHRGRVMVRGMCRAGRPAPAARLRLAPALVSSAAWILGLPFGAGFGDVMACLSWRARCEDRARVCLLLLPGEPFGSGGWVVGFAICGQPGEVIDGAQGDEPDELAFGTEGCGDGFGDLALLGCGGLWAIFGPDLAQVGIGGVKAKIDDVGGAVLLAQVSGLRECGRDDVLLTCHGVRMVWSHCSKVATASDSVTGSSTIATVQPLHSSSLSAWVAAKPVWLMTRAGWPSAVTKCWLMVLQPFGMRGTGTPASVRMRAASAWWMVTAIFMVVCVGG